MINHSTADVFVRPKAKSTVVHISSSDKPLISPAVLEKWQGIVDICARILKVPSGLIMRVHGAEIEVLVNSNSPNNVYRAGEKAKLGMGLYCETVIGSNKTLIVADAAQDPVWNDNPDMALGMKSYLGMPIHWPDSEVFGTICALDQKENNYTEDFVELLNVMRQVIESDLGLLVAYESARTESCTDILTHLFNRRLAEQTLEQEFSRHSRHNYPVSIIMFDIDHFKRVNDSFGHDKGDLVLATLSDISTNNIRKGDILARWGGEEFLLICPNTPCEDAIVVAGKLRQAIEANDFDGVGRITCSFGVSEFMGADQSPQDGVKRADQAMYSAKENGRNRVESCC